ncbi:MAG: SRPBCC family protein [Chloroflexota bacterium]
MKVKHTIIINRPIDQVFAFVTDLQNETRWQPEIKSVTLEGPLQIGSTFREARVTFGRTFDWHFRITELDPPNRITIDTISGTARYRGSRIFEAMADGTKVTEVGELEMPRLFRVFDPLLSQLSQWPLRRAYSRLKRLIEAEG